MAMLGKWIGFSIEELFEQALEAFQAGDWDSSIERFTTILELAGDATMLRIGRLRLAQSYASLGRKFAAEGDLFGAVKNLEASCGLLVFPDVSLSLAQAYEDLGLFERSEDTLRQTLEMCPNMPDAIFEMGLLYYLWGRRIEGMQWIFRAVQLDSKFAKEELRAARQASQAGDHDSAILHLKSLRSASKFPSGRLHAQLGDIYFRDLLFHEAREAFAAAAESDPDFPDYRCKLGQVEIELGNFERAVSELQTAIRLQPRYAEAYAQLSRAYFQLAAFDEARSAVENALAFDPNCQTALGTAAKLGPLA